MPGAPAPGDSLAKAGGPDIGDTLWTDVRESFTDALLLFSAPARFGEGGWLITCGVVAGTGGLMALDEPVRDAAARWHGAGMDRAADVGNFYGVGIPTIVVATGLYATGLVADAPGLRRAGRHVVQAGLYAGVITLTLKALIGRHRPMLNHGAFRFNGPSLNDDFNALPSGHSALAFALSSTLAAEIDHPAATAALYGLATLTAVSRIYRDRHWLSDTFLGAAIGTACGYGVVHLHDADAMHGGLMIVPAWNGIGMLYRF